MAEKLIDLLPERFSKINEVINFESAIDNIMIMAEEKRDELIEQLNVDTATWGLEFWEKQYGLNTDISKEYETRRSRIKSKMRGCGTTTKELIKNISESFVNGKVDVREHNDEYYFDVEMIDTIGLPPNMEDLKAAIEEAKPAHLNVVYIIKYNTHNIVGSKTHKELLSYTHVGIRENIITGI